MSPTCAAVAGAADELFPALPVGSIAPARTEGLPPLAAAGLARKRGNAPPPSGSGAAIPEEAPARPVGDVVPRVRAPRLPPPEPAPPAMAWLAPAPAPPSPGGPPPCADGWRGGEQPGVAAPRRFSFMGLLEAAICCGTVVPGAAHGVLSSSPSWSHSSSLLSSSRPRRAWEGGAAAGAAGDANAS